MADTIGDNEALAYAIQRASLDLEQICNTVYWIGPNSKLNPRSMSNDQLVAKLQRVIEYLQHIQAVFRAETANPNVNLVAMLHHEPPDNEP